MLRIVLCNLTLFVLSYTVQSQPIPGSPMVQNFGTTTSLSNVTYAFQLSYTAGSGYTFRMATETSQPTVVTFSTSDGTQNNVTATSFTNAISVDIRASFNASSATLSNLAFTMVSSPDPVPSCGSFTPLMTASYAGPQSAMQWLVSDTDLSLASWRVTGSINLYKSRAGSDEGAKLSIATSAVIPAGVIAVTGSCPSTC